MATRTLAAPSVQGLQARPAQQKAGGLRGFATRAKSAYARFRTEGLAGKRTGKVGEFLQQRWRGLTGTVIRAGASAIPGGSRVGAIGDILLGAKRSRRKGQTVNVRDPFTGTDISRTFAPKAYRGEKTARKLGSSLPGLAAQQAFKRRPESTFKFLASRTGKIAAGAATALGAELGVRAYRGFRRWQRAPKLRERTLKEFRKSPEHARIVSRQRKALQARNLPIRQANIAARQRQLQQGRSAFAARERTITPRGFRDTGRRPTITRGYQRQIGRVAETTISRQRGEVQRFGGGSTAARAPYRGAARISTYRPSTSSAAMSQRGRWRGTSSGSTYVTKTGRGGISYFGTPSRRAPTARGSYPSRAAYRPPTRAPSRSAPKRSYASFRSQVKVSPARSSSRPRSSSRSFTPFARR